MEDEQKLNFLEDTIRLLQVPEGSYFESNLFQLN